MNMKENFDLISPILEVKNEEEVKIHGGSTQFHSFVCSPTKMKS